MLGFFCSIRRISAISAPYAQRDVAALICTILALYVTFLILNPFAAPITWGTTLAITSYPLFQLLDRLIQSRSLRACLMTTLIGITVIVPSVWVLHSLVLAAFSGLNSLVPEQIQHQAEEIIRKNPNIARVLGNVRQVIQISGVSDSATNFLTTLTKTCISGSLRSVGHSILMLFVIFFLLRDGPLFLQGIKRLIPLSNSETSQLLTRIVDTIHATLLGMIAVAVLQGALGALLLWWLGISHVIVWGAIMALLALVPYLGTFIVWIPIAASLAMQGQWLNTFVTIIWGGVVIGLSDNVLYPYLVGQRLHYHPLIVFFFLLGGVLAFGASGAILGPVILAITERLLWNRTKSV